MKVRHLNTVGVGDPDPADSSRSEIHSGRNSKAPEPHYKHGGALEHLLPLGSHLGEDEVSAVALCLTSS